MTTTFAPFFTDRGMTRAMLFPKAILKAEWDAAAPLRDGLEWAAPRRVKPVNRERAPAGSNAEGGPA